LIDKSKPQQVVDAVNALLQDEIYLQAVNERGASQLRNYAWPLLVRRFEGFVRQVVNMASEAAGQSRQKNAKPAQSVGIFQ
jgi:hypothetical protein